MDTFDTLTSRAKAPGDDTAPFQPASDYGVRDDVNEGFDDDIADETPEAQALKSEGDQADDAVKSVVATNWWKVAALSLGAVTVAAAAAGGYVYWRAQQKTPQSRFERFKNRLGLDKLPLDKFGLDRIDFAKLEAQRRKATEYARQAAHKGAKKVVELTA